MAYQTTLFRMSGSCIQFPASMPYSCIRGVHCIPCCGQWLRTRAILHPCEERSNLGTSPSWEHFTISEFVQVRMFTVVECQVVIIKKMLSFRHYQENTMILLWYMLCSLDLGLLLQLWTPSLTLRSKYSICVTYSGGGWHVLLHNAQAVRMLSITYALGKQCNSTQAGN